jgi:uncharacterized Rossmann fold enzyme
VDPQLISALVAFSIIVLGGLGTLVTALIAWLAHKLDNNTGITTQARDASNGRLSEVLNNLAAEKDRVMGLRYLVRERDDRIAYIVARLPAAEQIMRDYRDQRTIHATQADEIAAERHMTGDIA